MKEMKIVKEITQASNISTEKRDSIDLIPKTKRGKRNGKKKNCKQ